MAGGLEAGDIDPLMQLESALWRACDSLLLRHTNPWELDEILKNAGFEIGPCEVRDHIGLMDVLKRGDAHSGPVLARMVNEGRLGKISGVGYYRYPGGGGAVVDPLIEDLIREEAHFAKISRVERDDAQIMRDIQLALRTAMTGIRHMPTPQRVAQRLQLTPQGCAQLLGNSQL